MLAILMIVIRALVRVTLICITALMSIVWEEDYGLAILDRKENKYMAQMEPKTFTMSNVQKW